MQWNSRKVFTSIAQVLFGITFIFSGILKGIDPVGTAIKIEEYFSIVNISLDHQLSIFFSVGLNVFEALLGVAILIGFKPSVTRYIALFLMSVMTLLTLYIYLFDPVSDCGCFGDAFVISNLATFLKNLVLIGIAILLFVNISSWHQWLPSKQNTIALVFAMVLIVAFNMVNIIHLPMIDFRPYKEGSDLMKLTQTGGGEGEYIYKFVYKKGETEKVFDIDELGSLDSTWTFVRDEIEVIKEAERPEGADFILLRQDGSNAVEDLAYKGTQAILIISPNLKGVDLSQLMKMIDKSPVSPLLAVGNSDEIWSEPHYRDIESLFSEVYFLDKSTAQTIIRSNPGVVIFSGGKILKKLSGEDFIKVLNDDGFTANPFKEMSREQLGRDFFVKYGWVISLALIYVITVIILGISSRIKIVRSKSL